MENREFCPTVYLDFSVHLTGYGTTGCCKTLKYSSICVLLVITSRFRLHWNQGRGTTIQRVRTNALLDVHLRYSQRWLDCLSFVCKWHSHCCATRKLWHSYTLNKVHNWESRWKIDLNHDKSLRVDYALKLHGNILSVIGNQTIPLANVARYLELNLYSKLN